jgi:hypothetical protein
MANLNDRTWLTIQTRQDALDRGIPHDTLDERQDKTSHASDEFVWAETATRSLAHYMIAAET